MRTTRIPRYTPDRFGVIAVDQARRVVLPLKGVECEFTAGGGLVEVVLTQIFRQENPKPLDCHYLFPLPADASVFSCEADINGRIIRAQVRERGEAVKLAAEKKAEGRRVAVVEAERENLFTLTLNNLQPDDLILVTLKYVQPLRSLADMPSIEIPFCPGVRYIPGKPILRSNRGKGTVEDTDEVPDASRISPVRIDPDHPDAAFVEIHGTVDARFMDMASLTSPTHTIVSHAEGDSVSVRLSDKGQVPDKDFVLRWRESEPESLSARAWLLQKERETYALLELRAPKADGVPQPMDFYLLVDRSGSMQGEKWEKAALAVQSAVAQLTKLDRVMVTLFNSTHIDFAEKPLSPREILGDAKFRTLARLGADGGTELGPALRHVVEASRRHSRDRQKAVILITDAQVGNESAILQILEGAPELALHCFGLDLNLNDALLIALARQQGGTFHSLKPGDDVAGAVKALAQTVRHPVLREVTLSGGWEPSEAAIPPLYSGQVYYFSARRSGRGSPALTARNGDAAPVAIAVAVSPTSREAPYLHWCKHRIQRHVAERREADAIALSEQSNLICPLTAFIAWDEAEKVAVADHALAQPVFEEIGSETLCSVPKFAGRPFAASRPRVSACNGPFMARYLSEQGEEFELTDAALPSEAAPPKPPTTIFREIVEHLSSDYLAYPGEPFTSQERRAALENVMEDLHMRLNRPEWAPLCEAVLKWAFAEPLEVVKRTNRVVLLLNQLTNQAVEIENLWQEVIRLLETLSQRLAQMAPVIDSSLASWRTGLPDEEGLDRLQGALDRAPDRSQVSGLHEALERIHSLEAGIRCQLEEVPRK